MRNDGGGEGGVKRGESMEELKALWEREEKNYTEIKEENLEKIKYEI